MNSGLLWVPTMTQLLMDAFGVASVLAQDGPDTEGLATYLRGFFGPLFLVLVSIVAIFYLFTKEITKFVQFFLLAVFVGILFYVPSVVESLANALAAAMGID